MQQNIVASMAQTRLLPIGGPRSVDRTGAYPPSDAAFGIAAPQRMQVEAVSRFSWPQLGQNMHRLRVVRREPLDCLYHERRAARIGRRGRAGDSRCGPVVVYGSDRLTGGVGRSP